MSVDWADLPRRFGVGALVAGLGFGLMWFGGWPFTLLVALISAVMIWELVVMIDSRPAALLLGFVGFVVLIASSTMSMLYALPALALPALAGYFRLDGNRGLFVLVATGIMVAGFGLLHIRGAFGVPCLVWLALVVVVTDILGYFVGRTVGGPKFWPSVSPKKTWSGTVGGWFGALVVGALFMALFDLGPFILFASVLISMASQAGDIFESSIKRRMGVKDSSNLLPGHGGVFDRFDGVVGAVVFSMALNLVFDFMPLATV